MQQINCKGKLIDLNTPKIMGILNITPDSFYDGGHYNDVNDILRQTEKMLSEGATFIDIGGYSSRPNAKHINEEEELNRVLPIVNLLVKNFPDILISLDTFRSSIAKKGIDAGAALINDISGGSLDDKMFKTVAQLQVPYILMHLQGTPQTMQQYTSYSNLIKDILFYFSKKVSELRVLKVNDIIIDVGFGFAKTLEQNYQLLDNLNLFKILELPILTGISRKSMLSKVVETTTINALNATTAANTIALLRGTNILRVHDVKEAMEAIKIVEFTRNSS